MAAGAIGGIAQSGKLLVIRALRATAFATGDRRSPAPVTTRDAAFAIDVATIGRRFAHIYGVIIRPPAAATS